MEEEILFSSFFIDKSFNFFYIANVISMSFWHKNSLDIVSGPIIQGICIHGLPYICKIEPTRLNQRSSSNYTSSTRMIQAPYNFWSKEK